MDRSRLENGQKDIIEGFAETEAGIAIAGNDHVRDQDYYEKGDLDAGLISCGQGIGLAHAIPTTKEGCHGR